MRVFKLRDDLVIQEIGEEWLVYDPSTQDVHLLSESVAKTCRLLEKGMAWEQLIAQIPQGDLETALAILEQKKLLVLDGLSRRSFLARAAAASLVLSVTAPRPAMAASGCVTQGDSNCSQTDGTGCTPCTDSGTVNSQCNSKTCSNRYRFTAPQVPFPRPSACAGVSIGSRVCPGNNLACYRAISGGTEPSQYTSTSCRDLSAGGGNQNPSCTSARSGATLNGIRCIYFCCGSPV